MQRAPTPWKSIGRYGSVGIELVLSVVIGFFAGRWLDGRIDGHGWCAIGGLVLGTYAGFRAVWKTAKRAMKEAEKGDEEWLKAHPWERHKFDPNYIPPPDEAPPHREDGVAPGPETSQTGGGEGQDDDHQRKHD